MPPRPPFCVAPKSIPWHSTRVCPTHSAAEELGRLQVWAGVTASRRVTGRLHLGPRGGDQGWECGDLFRVARCRFAV